MSKVIDQEIAKNQKIATAAAIQAIAQQMYDGDTVRAELKKLDYNDRVMELCVLNGLSAYRDNASRHAANSSQFPLSGATFYKSLDQFYDNNFPLKDPTAMVKHIVEHGRHYTFNVGPNTQENAVLATYHVLRRFITDVMREFASLVRTPGQVLERDKTGLLIYADTGEIAEYTSIGDDVVAVDGRLEGPDAVSIEEVERTAHYFFDSITKDPAVVALMKMATQFAPRDVVEINRRKFRTTRQMFLAPGIRRTRDEVTGEWLPEAPLSWDDLLTTRTTVTERAAPRDSGTAW